MNFITISKTSGEINTHRRKNATSLYPPTANSSGDHTLEYLKKVFYPEVGVEDGTMKEPVGLVLDSFWGHFDKKVKAQNANHPLLKWLMVDGGITPKAQPTDVIINKVFKGLFRDLFE